MSKSKKVVKIENDFIFKAHYSLSAIEQKIVLFLASRLDPKSQNHFGVQVVPIKEMEGVLWDKKKVGNVYEYLQEVTARLLDRKIFFKKGTIIGGKKVYAGGINWFQSVIVEDSGNGVVMEFMFSERMKPFLLELNKYVRINALEVMDMRGKHSIRMYQIFKAERERTRKYKAVSSLVYGLDELKAMLKIGGKYKVLKDFRRNVLDPMEKEINTHSNEISIKYEYLKTRRKVTGIEFFIYDVKEPKKIPLPKSDFVPKEGDIKKLSRAQKMAYEALVKFGVIEGIAYRQMVLKIKGGDVEGFEDLFVNEAIAHFKEWGKQQKNKEQSAGTFVNWWTDKKVFDVHGEKNSVFFKITEKINKKKKGMEQENFDNRMTARKMTNEEFEAWYKENKAEKAEV